MRVWVYIPTGEVSNNSNVTLADKVEVDVETLDPLLEKLANESVLGTRVVVFDDEGTTHAILDQDGWNKKLRVIVG